MRILWGLLLAVMLGAAPASALDHYDPRNGFSLTLPAGWRRLTEPETAALLASIREHTPAVQLLAAFRTEAGELPCLTLSELPIENGSLHVIATALGSAEVRAAGPRFQGLGAPTVDERRQAVLIRSRTDEGLTLSAVFPGRISAVQLSVAFAPDTPESQLAPFEAIADSFRYEEGRGYAPRRGIPRRELLIVLAFGVMAYHGWRRARRREQKAAGPLEPDRPPEAA